MEEKMNVLGGYAKRLIMILSIPILGSMAHSQERPSSKERHPFKEIGEVNNTYALSFSPDGQILLSGGDSRTNEEGAIIQAWDVKTWKSRGTYLDERSQQIVHLAWSPSGNRFIAAHFRGKATIWDYNSGKPINWFEHFAETPTTIHDLRFVSEDKVFSASWHSIVNLWDLKSNRTAVYYLESHIGIMNAGTLSSDGKTFAWTDGRGLHLIDGDLKRSLGSMPIEKDRQIRKIVFDHEGTRLLCVGEAGMLQLFDTKTKKVLRQWVGHPKSHITCATRLNKSSAFVSADERGNIKLWGSSGDKIIDIPGNANRIAAIAVSPDDKLLAVSGEKQRIAIWNIAELTKSD